MYDLNGALAREYELSSTSWTISQATSAILSTLSFPEAITNQAFISQKISDFRYFRAGIRVTFRIVGNKFLYGALLCAFDPQMDIKTNFPSAPTVGYLSGLPHIILSASSGDAVIFDIPFINRNRAIDLQNTTASQMGKVYISVLNPLIDMSNTGSTAQVLITAQFLDPQLYYPHDNAGVGFSSYVATSKGHKTSSRHLREAANKALGKDISSFNGTKSIDAVVKSAKMFSKYASVVSEYAWPIIEGLSIIGLSKPKTTDKASVYKIDPFHDINTGDGIDSTNTIGFKPDNQISTALTVGGISVDEMNLKQLCGTPVLFQTVLMNSSSTPQYLTTPTFGINATFGDLADYADWVAQNFRYVSGSRKVKLYIKASMYHSARIVFFLTDNFTTYNWVNCYHRVVDIQGDTELEFTLPYSDNKFAAATDATGSGVSLIARTLSWSQTDFNTTAPIYINVYTSASGDIEFGGLLEKYYQATSCPRNDFSKDFEPFHPSLLSYEQENYLFGEKYESVRHIVHRYTPVSGINTTGHGNIISAYYGNGNLTTKLYTGLQLWGLLYRFWRGSLRFKYVHQTSNATNMNVFVTDGVTPNGTFSGTSVNSTTNPVNEIEVPYYWPVLFQDTSGYDNRALICTATLKTFLMTSAGDDFSFMFIHPPPPGSFVVPPVVGTVQSSGNLGLSNFLDGTLT